MIAVGDTILLFCYRNAQANISWALACNMNTTYTVHARQFQLYSFEWDMVVGLRWMEHSISEIMGDNENATHYIVIVLLPYSTPAVLHASD